VVTFLKKKSAKLKGELWEGGGLRNLKGKKFPLRGAPAGKKKPQ